MFVCICRAVTESRVRAIIASGACTLDTVERACGAGGDCGTCRAEIADLLAEPSAGGRADSEAV